MKFIKKALLTGALALGLGFSAPAMAAPAFNITDVIRASDADLQTALDNATARGDTFAMQCYQGTLDYNHSHPQHTLSITVVGPVSGFQELRDGVKDVQGGVGSIVPPELVQACGPLALDAANDINRAGLTLGLNIFGLKL